MNAATSNNIANHLSWYVPCTILLFGDIGCIFNFVTFTSKKLRENPCGWYFLMSSLVDFCFINFTIISKLASEHFGSNLQNTSRIYCKWRIFLTWTLPCISTSYLVLAAIDRCLSTSLKTHFRSFSRIKVARRLTIIPVIVYSLTTCHQFIYFDLRPNCAAQPGGYSIFISFYSIVWTSLIPQSLLFTFGLITYKNIRSSRSRLARETRPEQINRTDIHLIKMTLVQVVASSILLNIRTIYYSYYVLSTNLTKGENQLAFESLLYQVSNYFFNINFSKNFYLNTLMSQLFRQVLFKRLISCFNRIIPRKFRIHPLIQNNNQINQFSLKRA